VGFGPLPENRDAKDSEMPCARDPQRRTCVESQQRLSPACPSSRRFGISASDIQRLNECKNQDDFTISIGRPKALDKSKAALAQRMHAGGEPASIIAASLGVSRATIYRVPAGEQ
jgi:Helix-turn-helix domain of resolvase